MILSPFKSHTTTDNLGLEPAESTLTPKMQIPSSSEPAPARRRRGRRERTAKTLVHLLLGTSLGLAGYGALLGCYYFATLGGRDLTLLVPVILGVLLGAIRPYVAVGGCLSFGMMAGLSLGVDSAGVIILVVLGIAIGSLSKIDRAKDR